MRKLKLIAICLGLTFYLGSQAQVTIGTKAAPDSNALLDLKENDVTKESTKGFLPPRVALTSTASASPMTAHVAGMFVYNTVTNSDLKPGIYYDDGTKWNRSEGNGKEWFYMPSFNLPVTATGTDLTFDLYAEYQKQFTKSGNTQFVSSNTTATTARPVYAANQLDYFVIAYPSEVIKINSISTEGVMNYDVLSTNIPERSFINIVFAVK